MTISFDTNEEMADELREIVMKEIEEIAALPSKDALYAKVLGTMLAPITSLAVVLGQIVEKSGGSVESQDESAEAEAPAAE